MNKISYKHIIPNLEVISWIILIMTSLIIAFFSSWFFLGNETTHQILKQSLIENLLLRTLSFSCLGIPSIFLIGGIELYTNEEQQNRYLTIAKATLFSSIVFLLSGFIGCCKFFLF